MKGPTLENCRKPESDELEEPESTKYVTAGFVIL